ncbi:hypothetical protein Rs2_37282 [Raphanus sativus]|nr:hypothetical protein Rs2_37282 [Raphanus sativus]
MRYNINIDVTGYHGDNSATFFCGDVDEKAKKLVRVTKEKSAKSSNTHKYGVVQNYVGHGTGRVFHTDPTVHHSRNNVAGRMMLNQTFSIEPVLTIGSITPDVWFESNLHHRTDAYHWKHKTCHMG